MARRPAPSPNASPPTGAALLDAMRLDVEVHDEVFEVEPSPPSDPPEISDL